MRTPDGGLSRTARNGATGTQAVLEDYSYYISGLLSLHRASAAFGQANPDHLVRAQELTETALTKFSDPDTGALYDTLPDQSDLIVRTRSAYDGAVPAGQSVMIHNFIDLYDITRDQLYLDRAIALLGSMSRNISESPVASINATRALHRLLSIDSSLADRFGPPASEPRPAEDVDTPVQVLAAAERVSIPTKGGAILPIRIEIDEKFHINAHDPGVQGLEPLRVGIAGGTGFEVSVEYPAGTPYAGSAIPDELGTLLVHEGAIELSITIMRTDEPIVGRPLIVVTYQVCSDTACFQPITVELDVALDAE